MMRRRTTAAGAAAAPAAGPSAAPRVPLTAPGMVDARTVLRMLDAQRAYFAARKGQPHVSHDALLGEARRFETNVRSLIRDALARERVELPGFEQEGGVAA